MVEWVVSYHYWLVFRMGLLVGMQGEIRNQGKSFGATAEKESPALYCVG